MTNIDALKTELVATLAAGGTLSDPAWIAAFHDIDRGAFVPHYFVQTPERSGWVLVDSSSPQWSTGVYSNQPLITQLDGDDQLTETARRGVPVTGVATSSSSQPSLMALMLEALNVEDGHTILEIGTATGYNAALLCHRVGPGRVTSIDIDAGLVDKARRRLASMECSPVLVAADGRLGHRSGAPYDRVIATVGVRRVPAAWVEQTRVGGVILLPLDRRNCGGLLARLTVHADGTARGAFLPEFGGFMPVRSERHYMADRVFRSVDDEAGDQRHTDLPANVVTDEASPFEFFAALTVSGGGWDHLGFIPDDGSPAETWIAQGDGSWVCHTSGAGGTHTVRQGGPSRLWDRIETAHRQWRQLGQPTRERFGLSVQDGRETIWLDGPAGPHQWDTAG